VTAAARRRLPPPPNQLSLELKRRRTMKLSGCGGYGCGGGGFLGQNSVLETQAFRRIVTQLTFLKRFL